MCMNLRRFCTCGRNSAYLNCRDNLQSLRSEWVAHVARLKAAGWRKAQAT